MSCSSLRILRNLMILEKREYSLLCSFCMSDTLFFHQTHSVELYYGPWFFVLFPLSVSLVVLNHPSPPQLLHLDQCLTQCPKKRQMPPTIKKISVSLMNWESGSICLHLFGHWHIPHILRYSVPTPIPPWPHGERYHSFDLLTRAKKEAWL